MAMMRAENLNLDDDDEEEEEQDVEEKIWKVSSSDAFCDALMYSFFSETCSQNNSG